MRRLVIVLVLLAAAVTVLRAYQRAGTVLVNRAQAAPTLVGRAFMVPATTPAFSSPASAARYLPALERAARVQRVNLFRTAIGYVGAKPEIVQFVFLTGRTRLSSAFAVRRGTWLTPAQSQYGADFLSTAASHNRDQIGRLAGLWGLPTISVRPLSAEAASQFFAGQYFVEATSAERAAHFLSTLDSLLDARAAAVGQGRASLHLSYSYQDQLFGGFGVPMIAMAGLFGALQAALVILLAVVLLYDGSAKAKHIGVMRLSGLSPGRIWWQLEGRLLIASLVAGAFGVVAAAWFLALGSAGLVVPALRTWAGVCGLSLIASGCAWYLVGRLRVPEAIKGRKRVGLPLTLDVLFKTGVLATAVLLSLTSWHEAAGVARANRELRALYADAPAFASYGVLDATVGLRMFDLTEAFSSGSYVQGRWLYPYLMRHGAIFVYPHDENQGPSGMRVITVSSSYLRAFPPRTLSGAEISVPDTTRLVVLIPASDRARAGRIRAQVLQDRRQDVKNPPLVMLRVPSALRHPRVSVMFYRDQWVQTLDPHVNPGHQHQVYDPVIRVLTLRNSLLLDREIAIGGGQGREPLKIPIHGSAQSTYRGLLPELRRLHLASTRSGLRSLRGVGQAKVSSLRSASMIALATAVGCVLAGLLLAQASLSLIFARWQRRVLVRRLHGFGLLRAYREWAAVVAATLVGEALLCAVAVSQGVTGGAEAATALVRVMACFGAIAVVEVAASLLTIRRRERIAISLALRKDW